MAITTVTRTKRESSASWRVRVEDYDPAIGSLKPYEITCISLYAALTVAWAQACRCWPTMRRTITILNGRGKWQEPLVIEGARLRVVEELLEEKQALYAARLFSNKAE